MRPLRRISGIYSNVIGIAVTHTYDVLEKVKSGN